MFEFTRINTAVTVVQNSLFKSLGAEASGHVRAALDHEPMFDLAVNNLKAGMTKYHAVATICLIRALLAEAKGTVVESEWFRQGAHIAMQKDRSKTVSLIEIDEFLALRESQLRETWFEEMEFLTDRYG